MKKLLYFMAAVVVMFTSCDHYDHAIADQEDRLDLLEQSSIKSIEEQIAAINASIESLEAVDTELENYIETLEAETADLQKQLEGMTGYDADKKALEDEIKALDALIEELKAKDAEIDKQIAEIKKYIDDEIKTTKDWANATFATLKQYSDLQKEVSSISELLAQHKTELTGTIEEAIKKLEDSMKAWVNKTLADGYYDIAAIDAKLEALQTKLAGADEALAQQIKDQQAALEQAKADLTAAYEKAISEAIETNNGVINKNIADAVNAALDQVDTELGKINESITDIKGRLDTLEGNVTALQTRIQSIRFMPEYSDGKVELDGATTLTFLISPKEAAGEITAGHVTSYVSRTQVRTKAVDAPTALTVEAVTGDASTGLLNVTVNSACLPIDFWEGTKEANVYICISDGNNDTTSEMIPSFVIPYVTFNAGDEQTLTIGTLTKAADTEAFEYSVGGAEWAALTDNTPVTFGGPHGTLRMRGQSETGTNGKNIKFGNTAAVESTGDIRTLIDWEDHEGTDTDKAVFANLFSGCTQLTSAPELPATELAAGCYQGMFAGCTSLTEAPELPAETLTANCYNGMFSGCTSLGSVTIKATDTSANNCMDGMLNGVELSEPSEIIVTNVTDIDAAPAGSTIRLGNNITASEIITIDKAITFDGNNHTLTSSAGRAINVSGADGVTIKNLTITASGERAINIIQKATNVTIDNVIATADKYTLNIAASAPGAVVTVKGSELTGKNTINLGGDDIRLSVSASTLKTIDNSSEEGYAAISIGTYHSDSGNLLKGCDVTVSDCKFVLEGTNTNESNHISYAPTLSKVSIDSTDDITFEEVKVISPQKNNNYYGSSTIEEILVKVGSGSTIILLDDLTIDQIIEFTKNITLDLNQKTITGTANRLIRVLSNDSSTTIMNIKNGSIVNNVSGGRCVETRSGNVHLILDNVTLSVPTTGNNQPLTVGGNGNNITVDIKNSEISTHIVSGYAITTFNPVTMNIIDSKIEGWCALNIKDADSSVGSAGSTFNIVSSELIGSNNVAEGSTNGFSTIMIEDKNVAINIDGNSTVAAKATNSNKMSLIGLGNETVTTHHQITGTQITIASGATISLEGENSCPLILSEVNLTDNTLKFPSSYAHDLKNYGWETSEATDGLVSITGKTQQ